MRSSFVMALNLTVALLALQLAGALSLADDFDRGIEELRRMNAKSAMKHFTEHLREHPKDARAYAYRGIALVHNEVLSAFITKNANRDSMSAAFSKARIDASESLKLDPNCAPAFVCRALTVLADGGDERSDEEKARGRQDIEEALRLDPKLVPAYFAKAAFTSDRTTGAQYLNQAIELDSKWAVCLLLRGLFQADKDKASADFDRVIETLAPQDAATFAMRGSLYWRSAFGDFPTHHFALPTKLTQEQERKKDCTFRDYQAAIKLDPMGTMRETLFILFCKEGHKAFWTDYNEFINKGDRAEAFAAAWKSAAAYSEAVSHFQALKENSWDAILGVKMSDLTSVQEDLDRAVALVQDLASTVSVEVVSVDFDIQMKDVVVKKSDIIEVAPFTEKRVGASKRVWQSSSITDTWNISLEAKGKVKLLFAEIDAAIRGGFERSTSQSSGSESEDEGSVTIKAGASPVRAKIVWIDRYRTGRAKIKIDEKTVVIPFEMKDVSDVLTESVDQTSPP